MHPKHDAFRLWQLLPLLNQKGHSVLLAFLTALTFLSVGPAGAVPPPEGTVLADLVVPNSDGLGIGFDGTHLYWLDFAGATLHKITTAGAFVADIPIVGCTATVISWDASRNVFWGAAGTQISQIKTDGTCTPQFDVALKLPGNCDNGFGCSSLVDGINYDPSDDTIWYSPDASERVYHYDTLSNLIGFFDVNDAPNDMIAECGFNYSSGVATGVAPVMYLAANGCDTIFKYDKAGNKLGSFVIGAQRHEDIECDNVTFKAMDTDAMWIKDAFDDHIRAFAVEKGTCVIVDDEPPIAACRETVNPHGKRVPPAGSTTLPGPKGGQNEDGFYELLAKDVAPPPLPPDPDPEIFVVDTGSGTLFGPFASGTRIKYTEANGATPGMKKIGSTSGQAGAIAAHITGTGDAAVFAVDAAGNESDLVFCLVPPPPK